MPVGRLAPLALAPKALNTFVKSVQITEVQPLAARFGSWTRSTARSPSLQVPPAMTLATVARQATVWDPHRAAAARQARAGCHRPAPWSCETSKAPGEVCAARTLGGSQWSHGPVACYERFKGSTEVFNKQTASAKGPAKLEDAMMYATTPHMFSAGLYADSLSVD